MGGILARHDDRHDLPLAERLHAAAGLAGYRGPSQAVHAPGWAIAIQSRHGEAQLLHDDHTTLALHGYITPSSLARAGVADLAGLQRRLAREEPGLLQRLDGEFSLLFRHGDSDTLLFYCTPSATRPLYFARHGRRLAVASEIGQLLQLTDLGRILNPAAWTQHLIYGHQLLDLEQTLYRDVSRARSGCLYRFEGRSGRLHRQQPEQDCRIDRDLDRPAAGAALLGAVQTAVADCPDDGPVGLALSGGLDSGMLLACARRQEKWPALHSYSIAFPGWEMDESDAVGATLQALDCHGQLIDGTSQPPSRHLHTLSQCLDLAPATLTDSYIDILAPAMHADGCRYRLSGFAGDLTLGFGLSYLADYARHGRLFTAIRDALRYEHAGRLSPLQALRRLYRLVLSPSYLHPERQLARLPSWLHPGQREVIAASERHKRDYILARGHALGPRLLLLDILRAGAWSDLVEQRAAQWGMELLSPLAHQAVLDHSFHMPPHWLDGGRCNRQLIRQACVGLVPDSARRFRPKVMHDRYVTGDLALLDLMGDPQEWSLSAAQLIDVPALGALLASCRRNARVDIALARLLRAEALARRFDLSCEGMSGFFT